MTMKPIHIAYVLLALVLLLLALSACACQRDEHSGFTICAGVLP